MLYNTIYFLLIGEMFLASLWLLSTKELHEATNEK